MFDAHANLAISLVAVGPSPSTSGTSLVVTGGTGSKFPAVPFNCTVYPNSVPAPLTTNAEIIRVTNVTGDVFTIVRAQEGTTAKPIVAGYVIENSISVKVFTDIESAMVQGISAVGGSASGGTVFFDNSPTVSFGRAGQTITASALGGGGGGLSNINVSAGTTSQNLSAITFNNANGLSFGLDAALSQVTASYTVPTQSFQPIAYSASNASTLVSTLLVAGSGPITVARTVGGVLMFSVDPQTTQPVAASASNGSFLFSTLAFSNANNVTFGTSAGSIITASVGAGTQSTQPVAASASNGSFLFSTLGFSNGNGVTFGTSAGSIVTASVAAATQSTQPVAASASNGSFLFSTLGFSNGNGVTFGTSAGSIITASVAAAAGAQTGISGIQVSDATFTSGTVNFKNANGISFGSSGANGVSASYTVPTQSTQPVAASASNGSFLFSTLGFSNGNGVTFGTSAGSIITASVSTAGAAVTNYISSYANFPMAGSGSIVLPAQSVSNAVAFNLPGNISASFIRFFAGILTNSTTLSTLASTMNGSAEIYSTYNAVVYSVGTGGSSKSLMSVASGSAGWTLRNSISVDTSGTQYSITMAISGAAEGSGVTQTTQYSLSQTNYSFTTNAMLTNISGTRFIDVNFNNSLSCGAYWLIFGISTSTASNSARVSAATNCRISCQSFWGVSQPNVSVGPMFNANLTASGMLQNGSFSTAGGGTTANLPISAISSNASNVMQYFQLIRSA